MAFPVDFSDQQQQRMAEVDRELQGAMQDAYRALRRAQEAKARFVARGLTALWPPLATDFVHRDRDASTREEQLGISNAIDHALATLLNEGAAPGGFTSANAAAVWKKYAR